MKRILLGFLKVLIPVSILVAGYFAFRWLNTQQPEFTPAPVEAPSFLVGVEIAERSPVRFEVHSQGTVSPRTSTMLVSEVSGQIKGVMPSFVVGGFFQQGDELLNIDPRNYETSLARAKLNLARARTRVETESALTGYALDDWKRLRELDSSTAIPSELALRKPQLQEVLAEYDAAEAELKKANEDLIRTTIRAPYDGMILRKHVDKGQFVNAGSQLAQSVAVDFAEVRLPIVLADLRYIELPRGTNGTPIPVVLESEIGGEELKWTAEIVRTEGVIDEQSRVIHAVAQVSDPYDIANGGENILRFGTYVHARIQGNEGGNLFVVPRHAVHKGTTMWIVAEDDTIQPREVTIVRSDEDYSYISNGINDGDVYCVTPIDRPLPGMKVRISG